MTDNLNLPDGLLCFIPQKLGSDSIIRYKNGLYQGNITNSVPNGLGVFFYDTGEFYYGQWSAGHLNGEGVFFFSNGSFIRSGFAKSKAEGVGYLHASEKEAFLMKLEDGQLKGEVTNFSTRKNRVRVLNFMEGKFNSIIKEYNNYDESCRTNILLSVFELGSEFMKELLENSKWMKDLAGSFIGSFYLGNKSWYHGVIVDGVPNGFGLLQDAPGKTQIGKFKDGILDGHCRIIWENGLIMDGLIEKAIFNENVILYDFATNEWKENYLEKNEQKKELRKGFGYPRNDLMKYRAEYFGNITPKLNQVMDYLILDNRVSRERLFAILYGEEQDQCQNDLDFGWDEETEIIYGSEQSEPQLSFGGDKRQFYDDVGENIIPYNFDQEDSIHNMKKDNLNNKNVNILDLQEYEDNNDGEYQLKKKNNAATTSPGKNSDKKKASPDNRDHPEPLSLADISKGKDSQKPREARDQNNLFNKIDDDGKFSEEKYSNKNSKHGRDESPSDRQGSQDNLHDTNDAIFHNENSGKKTPKNIFNNVNSSSRYTNENDKNTMSNISNVSLLSKSTKEMNWPSLFDITDVLILKRCFQRFDLNEPDLTNASYSPLKSNTRHNKRCIPQGSDEEKTATTEAFQNWINDYVARFMPKDELKKLIDKGPISHVNVEVDETTGLTNKYRRKHDMNVRTQNDYDKAMNKSYLKNNFDV